MTILEMITEWRKGCTNTNFRSFGGKSYKVSPSACSECTIGLIEAIEKRMSTSALLDQADRQQRAIDKG